MFSPVLFLTSLLPLTLALPSGEQHSPKPRTTSSSTAAAAAPTPFTMIAAHSGSPIHLQSINAANRNFYVGGSPSTYCPEPPADCPAGTSTVLVVEDGGCALDVVVPGGQLIYVDPTGALGFTQAHSSIIPAGAHLTTFSETTSGPSLGDFGFSDAANGFASIGWLACLNVRGGAFAYQVFADVQGVNATGCIGFDALTEAAGGAGAWEYV